MTDLPSKGRGGEADEEPAERLDETADRADRKQRQDDLLDEAVEETFPASDPIAPKRIT